MKDLIELVKPNGQKIHVNSCSLSYALSIGWVKTGDKKKQEKKSD